MNLPKGGGNSTNEMMQGAVQRAAQARQSGVGGRVMGGLAVGPGGQAQPSLTEAQYSVSGQRGRRAATINVDAFGGAIGGDQEKPMLLHGRPQEGFANTGQRGMNEQLQQAPLRRRCNLALFYNSQDKQSGSLVEQLVQQNTNPHPQLFRTVVNLVDIRQPDSDSAIVLTKISQMPQFRPILQSGCVLFDYTTNRAHHEFVSICQVIDQHKNAALARVFEAQIQQQNQQVLRTQRQETMPWHQQPPGGGQPQQRPQYNDGRGDGYGGRSITEVQQPQGRPFARRSLMRGASTQEEMERLAEEANARMRSGGGGINMRGGGGGGGIGGEGKGGGTLFDGFRNPMAVDGGETGSLTQINAKSYGR